jgi:hypothetical protein
MNDRPISISLPSLPFWTDRPGLLSVTFTGVDAETDIGRLRQINADYPVAEWRVLYSHTKTGIGRYPKRSWIESFVDSNPTEVRCALHLCGKAAQEWIEGESYLRDLARHFDRLQLNIVGARTNSSVLRQALLANAHPSVITQHHEGNAKLTQELYGLPNHAILFDGSGGRGRLPEGWPEPVLGVAGGYAGGLGPSTIGPQDDLIARVTQGQPYWLDMEQSLRDKQDVFDLNKVQAVLDSLSQKLVSQPGGAKFGI